MATAGDLKLSVETELQRIEEDCIHSGKAHFKGSGANSQVGYAMSF